MKVCAAVALALCLLSGSISPVCSSGIPTDLEMRAAAESWLRGNIELHRHWSDADPVDGPVTIVSTRSIASGDTLLAAAYQISSGGVIIVPATKRLPPVVSFSTRGDWSDIDTDRPCNHLLATIKQSVTRALRRGPDSPENAAWSLMAQDKTSFPTGTIIGVEPLMDGIDWFQCAPYNGACPSPGTCYLYTCTNHLSLLGCGASSLSRLLRYHAYPDSGTGVSSYFWNGDSACTNSPGDTLSADWSDLIEWDQMPESCSGGACTDSVVQATLAAFCRRVAVGLQMDFGHVSSSSSIDSVPPLLEDHLGYRCDAPIAFLNNAPWVEQFNRIRDEVNARRPLPLKWEPGGPHASCIDGWAIDNIRQRWVHINDDGGGSWQVDSFWTVFWSAYPGIRPLGTVDSVLVLADGQGDYETIQDAIDDVTAGCTIYLGDGTFAGPGNRDIDFGGKAVTVRSLSDNPSGCIIDCAGTSQDPHRGFYFHNCENGDTVVRGLTVTNGYASGEGGGAILCSFLMSCERPSTPLFINCVFRGNTADYGGAVAASGYSRPRLERCVLADNTAGQGSAFYTSSGFCSLVNCTIADNTCETSVQGAVCTDDGQNLLLDRCLLTGTSVGVSTTCLNGG